MDMGKCVGCGDPVAPSWKYCIHCGLAIERPEVPAAIRPDVPTTAPSVWSSNRALILGGTGIFLVGVALLVVAIAYFARAIH
jgi:hypothetical protein